MIDIGKNIYNLIIINEEFVKFIVVTSLLFRAVKIYLKRYHKVGLDHDYSVNETNKKYSINLIETDKNEGKNKEARGV